MVVHEIGLESSLLELVLQGKKTVEVRLNKGKFQLFLSGDQLSFRSDLWKDGKITQSERSCIVAKIVKIEVFPSAMTMLETVSFKKISPIAKSKEEYLEQLRSFYSDEDQKKLGLLVTHFSVGGML